MTIRSFIRFGGMELAPARGGLVTSEDSHDTGSHDDVGFVVGLFAPPLLAATAVGAVTGAGAGKLLHHRTASKLEEQAGETIPVGGAGLIVAFPHSAAGKVVPAVTRPIKKSSARQKATTRRRSRAQSPTRSRRWPIVAPDAGRRGQRVLRGQRHMQSRDDHDCHH